ncbi:hypothetical protein ACRAWF_10130 [Streptomyces sp. L7]
MERALHLGNGSGTYHATDTRTGEAVVLREARPHAGLDERGDDAVARLRTQQGALDSTRGSGLGAPPDGWRRSSPNITSWPWNGSRGNRWSPFPSGFR